MQLIELRSGREGHPSYRAVAHEMHAQIAAVHPAVAAAMTHVDTETEPRLERILSEMRTQARRRRRLTHEPPSGAPADVADRAPAGAAPTALPRADRGGLERQPRRPPVRIEPQLQDAPAGAQGAVRRLGHDPAVTAADHADVSARGERERELERRAVDQAGADLAPDQRLGAAPCPRRLASAAWAGAGGGAGEIVDAGVGDHRRDAVVGGPEGDHRLEVRIGVLGQLGAVGEVEQPSLRGRQPAVLGAGQEIAEAGALGSHAPAALPQACPGR